MNIDDLIKKIESETALAKEEVSSDEGLQRLQDVASEYQGEYRLIWSEETQKTIKDKPQRTNHLSGIKEIDDLTGGFREQQMIGIGAHSGHGKTAMGMYMLKQYEDLNPVLLPLEQSSEELIEQRTDNGQFVPKYLSPKKHESRVQVDWIEERIIEGIAKYNTKLVVIDHMGYVDAGNRYERSGEHVQIEKKLQDIKHLGIKWNVIIVILIQLNQLDETVPPSLKDLKGSSAIRQECDKVIFLWRKNSLSGKVRVYSNQTMFSLQKNRFNGVNGNLGLDFDFKSGEYLITPESKKWVEDMETVAKSEVDADDAFNG
jgi:replicative DNA helicase